MKKDPRFVNSYTDDNGNRISQYELLKSVADPEEKKEFDDIELKSLHKRIIRFTDNGFTQDTDYGPAIVKSSFQDAHKNNRELRKEVKKILKTDSETNKFFKAKSIDKYLEFKNRKQKLFETALDNVQEPKIIPTLNTSNTKSDKSKESQEIISKLAAVKNYHKDLNELANTSPDNLSFDLEKYIKEKAKASLLREDEELRKKYGNTGLGALGSWNKTYGDDE